MSRDYPTLDEQYGPGAEQADAEAQDDVATELQEAIDSSSEYNHRYWTEVAGRAVDKLRRLEGAHNILSDIADYPMNLALPESMRARILAYFTPSGEVKPP
jgi:hypothetical protein